MVALAAGACGGAYAGQKISVEKKGTYIYWLTYKDANGAAQVSVPERFKGKEGEVDLADLAKASDIKLHVLDKRTGNGAIVDLKPAADTKDAKPRKIAQDDFGYAPSVKLNVVSEEGTPLESALVSLTDGEGTVMKRALTPADGGVATFSDVAVGDLEVKVEADGAEKTLDSEFELPQGRKSAGFEKKIRVRGDVDTLPVMTATSAKSSKNAPEKSGGSGFLQGLVGLVLLGIIGAIGYVVVKSRGFTAQAALKKMGVQIPEDQQPAGNGAPMIAPVDPNLCSFCGQMKNASGGCACTLTSGASPFGTPTAAPGPSGPRLVGVQGTYMGSIFPIEGSATIGRDPGNEVPLSNDTTASRRHATIAISNGSVTIRDEGSSNGTYVNGARITDMKLSPGDEVQIGGTKFRFEA